MLNNLRQDRLSILSVALTAVLLLMGSLSMFGARLPHTQHRPMPSVQRGGACTEAVAAIHSPPPIETAVRQTAPPVAAPRAVPTVFVQPLLADAVLQARAP
ncbi:MAG: hypothetical protein ACYCW6_10655 [Candidatus Xenobia bacterium]